MSGINLWKFHSTQPIWGITNSYKMRYIWDLLVWKNVCDLWAWVWNLVSRLISNGSIASGQEIDPIFLRESMFQWAKDEALWKMTKLLTKTESGLTQAEEARGNIVKALSDNGTQFWTPDFIEGQRLLTVAKDQITHTDLVIADFKERIGDIESNEFENSSVSKRWVSLLDLDGRIDAFIMSSFFYSSKNPRLLLFALNKILSEHWEIIVIDHSDKPNIQELVKLWEKWTIEILDEGEWEKWRNARVVRIPKDTIPEVRKKYKRTQ